MIDLNTVRNKLPGLPEGHYFELVDEHSLGSIHWWSLELRRRRRWWFPETIGRMPVTGVLAPPFLEDLDDAQLQARIIEEAYYLRKQHEQEMFKREAAARREQETLPRHGRLRL